MAFVANASKIGGANRVLMDLVTRLDRSRYEPIVIAPTPGALPDWARDAHVPCRIVLDGDQSGWGSTLRRAAQLMPIFLRHRVRVVHAMAETCYRGAAVAATAVGARRIVHFGFPPEPEGLPWCLPVGPDALIGCYDGQAREVGALVQRFRPSCRAVGIPNGIDLARFDTQSSARSAVDGDGGGPIVLAVGHLSEVKGHPTFLRAAAIVHRQRPDCRFWLLGDETSDAGARARFEALVDELDIRRAVRFLGWRTDVPDVLRAADLVCVPSQNEGLPLAVLEAMACGRAVVATPVGGVPEAVEDGVTGLLVPPNQPEALASAVVDLLNSPARLASMGREGRRRAEAHFSLERVVRRVEDLYAELLA